MTQLLNAFPPGPSMAASLDTLRTLELPPLSTRYEPAGRRDDGNEDLEIYGRLFFRCSWLGGLRHGPATSYHHGRLIHEIKFVKGEREGYEKIFNELGNRIYESNWGNNRLNGYTYLYAADGKTLLMSIFYYGGAYQRSEFKNNGEKFVTDLGVDIKSRFNYDIVRKLILDIVKRTDALISAAQPPIVVMAAAAEPPPTPTQSGSKIMGLIRSSSSKKIDLRSSAGYREAVQRQRSNSMIVDQVLTSSLPPPPGSALLDAPPLILGDDDETFVFVDQWGKEIGTAVDPNEDLIELARKTKRSSRRLSLSGMVSVEKKKKEKKKEKKKKEKK